MRQRFWCGMSGLAAAGLFMANTLWGDVFAGEQRGVTFHHQAAGLTMTLATQPSPPRAGDNLLRVDLTDVQGQSMAHAHVRFVLTQGRTMPGMPSERPQEVEAISTHIGSYEGRVHLATPGRWEVIVNVRPPGRPATQAVFHLEVEPSSVR